MLEFVFFYFFLFFFFQGENRTLFIQVLSILFIFYKTCKVNSPMTEHAPMFGHLRENLLALI